MAVVGMLLDPAAPEVATVPTVCSARRPWARWRRCAASFAIPAEAVLIRCLADGTDHPGPSAAAETE